MSISVREFHIEELPKIYDRVVWIENACYAFPWSRQLISETFSSPHRKIFFVCVDDVIAGVCIYEIVLDEATIEKISVEPSYQGQGLGKKLLEESLRILKERDKISVCFLEVRKGNNKAHNLYLRTGFNDDGVRRNYYHTPTGREYAVLMSIHF